MGKIVTHELVPGGQMMPVTSENKLVNVLLLETIQGFPKSQICDI